MSCGDQRNLHSQIYKAQKKYSKPPVSLEGQLLWREFFYTVSCHRKTLPGCPNMHMGAAHCAIYYCTLHYLHLNRFECRNHHALASFCIQVRDERHAFHRLQVGAGTENFHQMEGNPICRQARVLEHAKDCCYIFAFIFACSAKSVTTVPSQSIVLLQIQWDENEAHYRAWDQVRKHSICMNYGLSPTCPLRVSSAV